MVAPGTSIWICVAIVVPEGQNMELTGTVVNRFNCHHFLREFLAWGESGSRLIIPSYVVSSVGK